MEGLLHRRVARVLVLAASFAWPWTLDAAAQTANGFASAVTADRPLVTDARSWPVDGSNGVLAEHRLAIDGSAFGATFSQFSQLYGVTAQVLAIGEGHANLTFDYQYTNFSAVAVPVAFKFHIFQGDFSTAQPDSAGGPSELSFLAQIFVDANATPVWTSGLNGIATASERTWEVVGTDIGYAPSADPLFQSFFFSPLYEADLPLGTLNANATISVRLALQTSAIGRFGRNDQCTVDESGNPSCSASGAIGGAQSYVSAFNFRPGTDPFGVSPMGIHATVAVPEPHSTILLAVGLLILSARRISKGR